MLRIGPRRRAVGMLVATATLALLPACGGDGSGATDEPSPPVDSRPTGCEEADPAACYSLGDIASAYCVVQQVRVLVRDGEIDLGGLPDWVDGSEVDGAPRIVDFRPTTLERPSAESADELTAAVRDAGAEIDMLALDRCTSGIDQDQVEGTEGPRT